jgi:transcriptional regulator with XRE-family HTH domain
MAAQRNAKVSGDQIRAARALLNLSAQELAEATKLSRGTIQRAELGTAQITTANGERIVEVLGQMGIVFLASNGGGPGVRLRR